jgi:hypothetical protein
VNIKSSEQEEITALAEIDKNRGKHGLKIEVFPLGLGGGLFGLILCYFSIASLIIPLSESNLVLIILIGFGLILVQSFTIYLLNKIKFHGSNLPKFIQLSISYFFTSYILCYFSLNNQNNLSNLIKQYSFNITLISLFFSIMLLTTILVTLFTALIVIPIFFVRFFFKINFQLLSIPMALILLQMFNKNTWEYAYKIENIQLLYYCLVIVVLPTIISLYLRKKTIQDWIDKQSIRISTKEKNELLVNISTLLSEENLIIINKKLSKINNENLFQVKKLIIEKMKKRYLIILYSQPIVLFIIISMIVVVILTIFPYNFLLNWTSQNFDYINLIIKESILIGGLAYTSLNLSLYAVENNLKKTYDELLEKTYCEDASLEIIHEIILQKKSIKILYIL